MEKKQKPTAKEILATYHPISRDHEFKLDLYPESTIIDAMEEYANLDRESSPVTWDVEAAAKKCIDALYTVNQYEAFVYGAQWQANRQSTTIERLTKALEEILSFWNDETGLKNGLHSTMDEAKELLASIKK